MEFWIIAGVITTLVAALLALSVVRTRGGGLSAGTEMQIYRDQLAEVDRDEARGVLDGAEAGRLRLEVSRRLLDADKAAAQAVGRSNKASPNLAFLLVILIFGGGYALYSRLGAPGYADLPLEKRIALAEDYRAERPSQEAVEAETPSQSIEAGADPAHLELMAKLRTALAARPDDLQGYLLLAQNEAVLGNFKAAHAAQKAVIRIKGDGATAADYADYVDLLALAAGGYVSPRAEAAIREVLSREPDNGTGRYYLGLMYAQTGRPDLAFRLWRDLLEASQADAPWMPPIRAQIETAAAEAGVRYELPALPGLAGPSQEDIDAAQGMDEQDRDAMVRSMVSQLSDRLASEGGTAQEWAQLIGALGVLGETARASAIWQESQNVFAADPVALETLLNAARRAGVAN